MDGGIPIAPGVVLPPDACLWSACRAGGPGGQHVNTTSSAVELRLDLTRLAGLPPSALGRLRRLSAGRLDADGRLMLRADEHRSQGRNRDACLERLRGLVEIALPEPVPRKKSKPSRGARERRLQTKRITSQRKAHRRTED